MSLPVEIAVTAAAAVGHFSIAVWLFNRLHAVSWPRPLMKGLERLLLFAAAAIVVLYVAWRIHHGPLLVRGASAAVIDRLWLGYAVVACGAAIAAIPLWLVPKLLERPCPALLACATKRVEVSQRLGFRPLAGLEFPFFAQLPGNELLQIDVDRKRLHLPNLPSELEGFSIAHLSDLHITGQLTQPFYDVVVDESNALDADLIVVTGDILEKQKCLPWIGPTLGRLQARRGKYFILGNHERRLRDPRLLREALTGAGLVDLGGRCEAIAIGGAELLIAGTERPWFGVRPSVPARTARSQCRLLLSHTPDELPWALTQDFDLMLAGHNHGGQIRLPYFGALIAPSLYGCRYAGGLYACDGTLLHVSRGVAGIHPVRLNCPPEIALLVLTAG
jgi:predicted MPP superfamily phosphohydrolase